MKEKFLNCALSSVKRYYPQDDDIKLEEIRYGLEGFYLSITKMIVITILAFILGVFKEMLIMLIVFNILRTTGFGLHATKSWICLLSSAIVFLFLPIIAKTLEIPQIIKSILTIVSIICVFLYAPADTKKRPLIKKRKRDIYKFITTVSCILLSILCVTIKDTTLSNLILFGIYTEVIIILPFTYRIFNLSYNNYKNYKPIYG